MVTVPYTISYRIRSHTKGDRSWETTIPVQVMERAAAEAGLPLEEFVKLYDVVFHYTMEPGARLTFQKRDDGRPPREGVE